MNETLDLDKYTINRNTKMNQQSTMRETLNLLNGVITGRRILNEGRVGQIADDLESLSDAEFEKEHGKTKAEMRKEFGGDKKSAVSEGIPNSGEDPNLAKAYNMGHDAYRAYKNDPEMAQAAQDKIESKFPQYAKMWLMGYHDGERFAAQEALNEDSHSVEDMAETALNAAAKSIQDALGVTDGDVAADFFTGKNAAVIMNILSEYIEQEMSMRGDEI